MGRFRCFFTNLGSFLLLPFLFCLPFLLGFWVASVRFSGISVFLRPCFLKINFVQHWQSLSAAQNYSSKYMPLRTSQTNPKKIFSGCLSSTNLLPTPSSDPSRKASEASLFSRWWDEQSSKTYVPMCGVGWISLESRHQLTSSYQQSRAAPPRSRHCATFLAMPPTSFSGAG